MIENFISHIEKSIKQLCDEFRKHPTRFYTESDIVSRFYLILHNNLPIVITEDKNGFSHYLIHREYPTPFRCNMDKNCFELKTDEESTPKGGKFKRGHYDLVIMNPNFIKHNNFEEIKGQNYELFKQLIFRLNESEKPVILYGFEFMYSRDPIRLSRGNDKEKGINEFCNKIIQDADKLISSKNISGFMSQSKMLTFIKGCSEEVKNHLKNRLSKRNEIYLVFAD